MIDSIESFGDAIRFAQRTLAGQKIKFCARGAPKFRKFCNSFVKFLREVCVISTPDACFFCKVIPYRLEKLGLLLHTSETRSLPRVATKRSTQKSETLNAATEVSGAFPN